MGLTAIPKELGVAGAHIAPANGAGKPGLYDLLEEHRAAIEALQSGTEGELVLARAATTGNRTLSGLTNTNLDGVTPVAGDIILVMAQSTGSQNGLYVAASGAWTRLKDASGADVIKSGMLVQVSEGTVNADKQFTLVTNAAITVGTTALTFEEVVLKGAVATTTVKGLMSAADKLFLDRTHEAAGANLGDADATIQIGAGTWRKLPASTLSANRNLTLGTTGAVAGDQITITRLDATANTFAIINGGAGAGTLFTMPASKVNFVVCQFDGTNWFLRQMGVN